MTSKTRSVSSRVGELLDDGLSRQEIVEALVIQGACRQTAKSYVWDQLPSEQSEAVRLNKNMRAGIMHLVDLKRAGHSPTRTEYKIAPDLSVAIVARRTSAMSYTSGFGSPAAMCSDGVGDAPFSSFRRWFTT